MICNVEEKSSLLVTVNDSTSSVEEFDSTVRPLKTAFVGEFVVVAVEDPQPALVFWDDEALHPQKREIPVKTEDIGFDLHDLEVLSGVNNTVLLCSGKKFALLDLNIGRRFDTGGCQELNSHIIGACSTKNGELWIATEDGIITVIDTHTGNQKCTIDTLAGVAIHKLQSIAERNIVAAIVDDGIMLFTKSTHAPFTFLEPPYQCDGTNKFVSVSSERYVNANPSAVSSTTIYAITSNSTLCVWSLFYTISL